MTAFCYDFGCRSFFVDTRNTRWKDPIVLLGLFILISISGCTLHEVEAGKPPPVLVPAVYGAKNPEAVQVEKWWQSFDDPTLESLVKQSLQHNQTLKAAWARLKQLTAIQLQAQSGIFPNIDAEVGYNRSRINMKFGDFASSFDQDRYALSISAGYEIDLWGRVGANIRATKTELRASREDLNARAITLAAQVAEIWFAVRALREQVDWLKEQDKLAQTHLEVLQHRFSQGFATAVEISQQKERIAALRTQHAPLKAQIQTRLHQLAVLTGAYPSTPIDDQSARTIPLLPPLPQAGVPADLLVRRPDVKRAQLAAEAADHRVGVAIADRFPALRIGGSAGFTSIDDLSTLLEDWVYSVVASLGGSVWDGGRRSAEVDRARAVVEERIHLYGETMLQAMREVNDALVLESKQAEYIQDLNKQLEYAQQTFLDVQFRYLSGVGDLLPVLNADEHVAVVKMSLLQARRQQVSYRIQLYRALGGTWTDALEPPETTETAQLEKPAPQQDEHETDSPDSTNPVQNTEEEEGE